MALTLNLLLGLKAANTGDKTVIVSVYAETLDILALVLTKHGIQYKRLDGSIATKKRQPIVDEFNDAKSPYLVLLLSNRAGGCGLNLIGANRLIMYDADWNPANDAQAMARVWRSGQLKQTYIYRLFSTGTMEEKIFQRQTFKSDLAEQLVAAEEDMTDITEFAMKELKRIFKYNKTTQCDTMERTDNKGYTGWDKHKFFDSVGDAYLSRAARVGRVSYMLKRIVNDPKTMKKEQEKEDGEEDEEEEDEEWNDDKARKKMLDEAKDDSEDDEDEEDEEEEESDKENEDESESDLVSRRTRSRSRSTSITKSVSSRSMSISKSCGSASTSPMSGKLKRLSVASNGSNRSKGRAKKVRKEQSDDSDDDDDDSASPLKPKRKRTRRVPARKTKTAATKPKQTKTESTKMLDLCSDSDSD